GMHARNGADLPGRAAPRVGRNGPAPAARRGSVGHDMHLLPAHPAILPALALVGVGAAGHRAGLHGVYPRFRLSAWARARGPLEGPGPGPGWGPSWEPAGVPSRGT